MRFLVTRAGKGNWVVSSVEQFLDDVACRGSWFGGGSVAALSAALSAALLEKLTTSGSQARLLRTIRRRCTQLIERDAKTFAQVIPALQLRRTGAFRQQLRAATAIQEQVFQHARMIQEAGRQSMRRVKPQFRSDLQCAIALAEAARQSASTLIRTNLAWLRSIR